MTTYWRWEEHLFISQVQTIIYAWSRAVAQDWCTPSIRSFISACKTAKKLLPISYCSITRFFFDKHQLLQNEPSWYFSKLILAIPLHLSIRFWKGYLYTERCKINWNTDPPQKKGAKFQTSGAYRDWAYKETCISQSEKSRVNLLAKNPCVFPLPYAYFFPVSGNKKWPKSQNLTSICAKRRYWPKYLPFWKVLTWSCSIEIACRNIFWHFLFFFCKISWI